MRINTLKSHDPHAGYRVGTASNEALPPGMGESFEEFEAELHSAIANLHVSDQNVTASDSHSNHMEMSAEMRTYIEDQMELQAGSATLMEAGTASRTILDLLR